MPSMPFPTSRLVWLTAGLLVVPPLMGAKGGCRCKRGPTDTDATGDTDTQVVTLERTLQVSRVVPDLVEPQTGLTADVLGAGLKERATVAIGPFEGTNVTVHTTARLSVDIPPLPEGRYDLTVTNPDGETVTLTRALTVAEQPTTVGDCREVTVTFGFDEDALSSSARSELDAKVPCFLEADGRIRIEGHADERGTIDYNLALGQRRADAVSRYLVSQTVPITRIRTVSYGEERPEDRGHDEAAWARNRRAVVIVED